MSSLQELGTTVRDRRSEMGLTQARLAKLSGLSRATVNQLENGAVEDLSFNRASKLLNAIGLTINVSESHPRRTRPQRSRRKAIDLAAMSASVSYKTALTPQALRRALTAEQLSLDHAPQLFTLVDEVPVSL